MPKIEQQNNAPPPRSPAVPINNRVRAVPSLLDDAIPINELTETWIKFCVYGQNRVGKTTLAAEFPKPSLLLACEPNKTGGANSVRKVPGIIYKRIESSEVFYALARELMANDLRSTKWEGRLQTVIVDSVTSLQDIVLKELMGWEHLPEQNSWGLVGEDVYRQRSEKTRERLRPYLDMSCHTVFVAKERDHQPPKGDRKPKLIRGLEIESFFGADLGGATAGWLHDGCDYLGRLYMDREVIIKKSTVGKPGTPTYKEVKLVEETGRQVRRLLTILHPNYAAGFRSCNPKAVPQWIDNPTYESIAEIVAGNKIKNGYYPEDDK